MNIKHVQRRLANGLSHWLQFEFDCVRGYLFSEKYLALPIGQLLIASCAQPVRAEVNHPVLTRHGLPGRPLQLDFVVGSVESPALVVETKWLGESPVKPADILWDLVRLELAAHHWKCDAVFVLAGLNKKVSKFLASSAFAYKATNGRTLTLLPTKTTARRAVRVQHAAKKHLKRLLQELPRYPDVKVPLSITSGQPSWYPKSPVNLSFGVWVWRVSSSAKRKTTSSPIARA